ncbi:MTRF1L release factor glutamine methyltransferase [Chrysoperla carnea]|uniref:MTRF1L release factor glutamine methyltransferase n=1 Tax=Chrysoperla carnea TaxID=189513 RepID=UPI001D0856E6|nr:MTRF1L release factor glutamine methyltransferase [Chrysoperla carnea]
MPYLTYNQLEIVLNNDTITEIDKLCELRLKRMPIQYIIGEWPFRDLNLKIKPPVFIPRPETEELVELVLKSIEPMSKTDLKIADICCGSGAISLALLKANNKISVIAVDRSNEACDLTKLNAQLNYIDNKRLEVLLCEINESNLLENINQTFDIIVSNPPYIPQTEISQLQPEILLYEDIRALDGGLNGFETIKLIITMSSNKLVTNGLLFLEIDPRHPQLIEDFLKKNTLLGLELSQIYKDFCTTNYQGSVINDGPSPIIAQMKKEKYSMSNSFNT